MSAIWIALLLLGVFFLGTAFGFTLAAFLIVGARAEDEAPAEDSDWSRFEGTPL